MGILDLLEFHEYHKIIKASREIEKALSELGDAMDEIGSAFDDEDDDLEEDVLSEE